MAERSAVTFFAFVSDEGLVKLVEDSAALEAFRAVIYKTPALRYRIYHRKGREGVLGNGRNAAFFASRLRRASLWMLIVLSSLHVVSAIHFYIILSFLIKQHLVA